jgi:hypothetical protein
MADMLSAHGLELPELDAETRAVIDPLLPSYASSQNPVDLTAQATREVGYARVIEILQRSPVADMVVVVGSLATETLLRRDSRASPAWQRSAVPIAFCAYTSPPGGHHLAAGGIPAYTNMSNCAAPSRWPTTRVPGAGAEDQPGRRLRRPLPRRAAASRGGPRALERGQSSGGVRRPRPRAGWSQRSGGGGRAHWLSVAEGPVAGHHPQERQRSCLIATEAKVRQAYRRRWPARGAPLTFLALVQQMAPKERR